MKRLLIVTQYYPPETGAPQNRLQELGLRLKDLDIDVEVLTAMPNYPKMEIFDAYRGKSYMEESIDGIKVYRSGIYVYSENQKQAAQDSLKRYQQALMDAGYGEITTEILDAPEFYYAEEYHQQYLAKNPGGYCGLGGTNVSYPV